MMASNPCPCLWLILVVSLLPFYSRLLSLLYISGVQRSLLEAVEFNHGSESAVGMANVQILLLYSG